MVDNWIDCLLEEYPELYDILDCFSLDIKIVLEKRILEFKGVKEIKVEDGMLCIDDYTACPLASVKKIITKHLFKSLENFTESMLIRSTSRLTHDFENFYVESTYEPSMQIRSLINA